MALTFILVHLAVALLMLRMWVGEVMAQKEGDAVLSLCLACLNTMMVVGWCLTS